MTLDPLEAILAVWNANASLKTALPTFYFDEVPQSPTTPYGWFEIESEQDIDVSFINATAMEGDYNIYVKANDNSTLYSIQNLFRAAFVKANFQAQMTGFNGVSTLVCRRFRAKSPDRDKNTKRTWMLEIRFKLRWTLQGNGGC